MDKLEAWPIFGKKKRKLQIQVTEGESLKLAILKIVLAERTKRAVKEHDQKVIRLRRTIFFLTLAVLIQIGALLAILIY